MNEMREGNLQAQPTLPVGMTIIDVINPEAAEAFLKVGKMVDKLNKERQLNDGTQSQGEVPLHPNGVDNFREFPSSQDNFSLTPLQAPAIYPPITIPAPPTIQTPAIPSLQEDEFFSPYMNGMQQSLPQFVQNDSTAEDKPVPVDENEEIRDFQCVDVQWVPNSAPALIAPPIEMMGQQRHAPTFLPPMNETFHAFGVSRGSGTESEVAKKVTQIRRKRASENLYEGVEKKTIKANKKQPVLSTEQLIRMIEEVEADANRDPEELRKLKNNLACRHHRDKKKNDTVKKESELEAIKRENDSLKRETQIKDEKIKKLVDVLNDVSNESSALSERLSQKVYRVRAQLTWS